MARVVLAMSGGVDSSVAASLLRDEGHDVIGLFMRHGQPLETTCATMACGEAGGGSNIGEAGALPQPTARGGTSTTHATSLPPLHVVSTAPRSLPLASNALPLASNALASAHKRGCCTASDALDARRVADRLGIPFYAVNFEEEFGRIIDYFVDEYSAGRTPNPCVMCNNWLKFGRLADYADSVGAEFLATGHYARLTGDGATPALCRGLDEDKDQSYVLFGIDREILPRVLFPVGDYRKDQIRSIARDLGLRVAEKRDSQEICFVAAGEHAAFVRQRAGADDNGGEIVTVEGQVVGRHAGIEHFTIGQRKGLGVAFGEPRFVVRIEPELRRVVVGTKDDLARREFWARGANWLVDEPRSPFRADVKIRYRSAPAAATVEPCESGRFLVTLDEPTYGVAPGQAAVCYSGDRVLGGGWIE